MTCFARHCFRRKHRYSSTAKMKHIEEGLCPVSKTSLQCTSCPQYPTTLCSLITAKPHLAALGVHCIFQWIALGDCQGLIDVGDPIH